MNNTHDQKTSPDHQDLSSIIDRIKSWGHVYPIHYQIYINYSKQLKALKSLKEITAFLSNLLDQNIFPSIVMINQIIKKMGHLNYVEAALEFHLIAVTRGLATPITYASTIYALAQNHYPDHQLTLNLLFEAKSLGFADAITYASAIQAIANSAKPDANLAIFLYNEANFFGFANMITYHNTNCAISKSILSNQPASSTLVPNSIFSNPKKVGLNTDAKEFVPNNLPAPT